MLETTRTFKPGLVSMRPGITLNYLREETMVLLLAVVYLNWSGVWIWPRIRFDALAQI